METIPTIRLTSSWEINKIEDNYNRWWSLATLTKESISENFMGAECKVCLDFYGLFCGIVFGEFEDEEWEYGWLCDYWGGYQKSSGQVIDRIR